MRGGEKLLGEYSRGRTRTADPGIMSAQPYPLIARLHRATHVNRTSAGVVRGSVWGASALTKVLIPQGAA